MFGLCKLFLPVFENTTQVVDHCDDPELVAPYTVPLCYGDAPCTSQCANSNPFGWTVNTYVAVSPEEKANVIQCATKGFKNVFALKAWHGRRGFSAPCLPDTYGGTLYLTKSITGSISIGYWDYDEYTETESYSFTKTFSVNRYTGQVIASCSESFLSGMSDGQKNALRNNPVFGIDHCADGYNIDLTGDGADVSTTETEIEYVFEDDLEHGPGPTPQGRKSQTCTVTLSNPYSAADVHADATALLELWNMCDDAQMPWRIDVPILTPIAGCGSVYLKNNGPSYGPFVRYDETGPQSPDNGACVEADVRPVRVIGAPISYYTEQEGSYPPWFDFTAENREFVEINSCCRWHLMSWGGYSPWTNATHWIPAEINNSLPHGAVAHFNYLYASGTSPNCTNDPLRYEGYLILGKYAEKYQHSIPPDAGKYSVKKITLNRRKLLEALDEDEESTVTEVSSMMCQSGALQGCGAAVFIQPTEPTGKYAGSLHIPMPTVEMQIGTVTGIKVGALSAVYFDQAKPTENGLIENTDCESGLCDDYVATIDAGGSRIPACEGRSSLPWDDDLIIEPE